MKPLPRPGTIARDVLDYLKDFSQSMPDGTSPRGATFSELLDTYVYSARSRGTGGQRQHASMNLTRILKAHAHKTGPAGSSAVWIFGKKPSSANEDARQWLICNDPEATDYWKNLPPETDFVVAMKENLRDFGPDKTRSYALHGGHTVIVAPAEPPKPFESAKTIMLRHEVEENERLLKESIENDKQIADCREQLVGLGKQTLLFLRDAVDERLRQISMEVIT